ARFADATRLVHVVFSPAARRPTSSSTLAMGAATLWAVEPDADVVVEIDPASGDVHRREPVGDRSRTVAIAGDRVLV
ncbi:hypothetical protein NL444_28335, partial [Klebsiella pneumoniae]|nr:hypothetical protein [Klebsiella pneumoniae]